MEAAVYSLAAAVLFVATDFDLSSPRGHPESRDKKETSPTTIRAGQWMPGIASINPAPAVRIRQS